MASKEPIPRYFFSLTPSEKKYSPGASVVAASKEPIITTPEQTRKKSGTVKNRTSGVFTLQVWSACDGYLWKLPKREPSLHVQLSESHHLRLLALRNGGRTPPLYTQKCLGVSHTPSLQAKTHDKSIIHTLMQVFKHFMISHTPSCVMQMDPQPMPTLRASTPASIRFFACAAVTTTERGKGTGVINKTSSHK